MPSGNTYVASVSEGLDTVLASARTTREYPANVMLKACSRESLSEGTGTSWREFLAAQLTSQNYGETDIIDNPQELDGSVISFTPQLVACQTFIGKRVQARLNRKAFGTFGRLAQQSMDRKKNQDGLALFSTFSTGSIAGTGTTTVSGHIMAAVRLISSDADEPNAGLKNAVLHGYQIYDIQSEVLGGLGSYPIPAGYTAETYHMGLQGKISDAMVWEDGLISVDSTPDVLGAVFAKDAVLCVQGMSPWTDKRYEPDRGYGGWNVWLKDEYVWGERSPGNWAYGIKNDGTAPTG
jgi:hypothetical protein